MANIFKNPLVISEQIVGSIIDNRSVVLYEQEDMKTSKDILDSKTNAEIQAEVFSEGTMLEPTVYDFINRRKLKELFKGTEIPYLSKINGFQMWGISYMDANVDINSDLCDHPIETGQMITDSSIENPISAEVNIAMPTAFYKQIYEEIKRYYKEKKKIMLFTKFGVYRNMVIESMPYKLENGTVDRAIITLNLREIKEVQPSYIESDVYGSVGIEEETSAVADDTDMEVVGKKRFSETLSESLDENQKESVEKIKENLEQEKQE